MNDGKHAGKEPADICSHIRLAWTSKEKAAAGAAAFCVLVIMVTASLPAMTAVIIPHAGRNIAAVRPLSRLPVYRDPHHRGRYALDADAVPGASDLGGDEPTAA